MTKKDLIHAVCNANPHLSAKIIREAIDLFFDTISFYLEHHQRIEIRGFGSFCTRKRLAHKAHNPQTQSIINVPEKIVPFFKASQSLKNILKNQPAQGKKIKHKKNDFSADFFSMHKE
jgi:integration host factor subunit beta